MADKTTVRIPRDRRADWAVVAVLAVALLLGWAVMAGAQGQRKAYTNDAAGLTVEYPQGWLLKPAGDLAFQALDADSGDFKTTYQVRTTPIDATGGITQALTLALNNASLARAQEGTAYQPFDIAEGDPMAGRPTMEASYVYVVAGRDLFVQVWPVVVEGLDLAVAKGDKAYIFSLLAAHDAFQAAVPGFRRFVESAELP